MENNSCSILIAGDVYPAGECAPALCEGKADQVFHDLIAIAEDTDYIVANLESPLTYSTTPLSKDGSNLKADPKTLQGLKNLGVSAFGLANNHIMDYGEVGLQDTISALKEHNIAFFGAGENLQEAVKAHVVNLQGRKVGFLAIAEHEFSIATRDKAGAYGLNIPDNCRQIRALKSEVDFLVVLYHGGKEHYPFPTPKEQNTLRYFTEVGADVVIAQHSHIIGAYEWHKGKFILYGQGNFLFELLSRKYNTWLEGVLVKLNLTNKSGLSVELIPYEQSKGFTGVKLIKGEKRKEVLGRMQDLSRQIEDTDKVADLWEQLCTKELNLYQSRLLGHNKYLRFLNRKIGFANWLYPEWKKNMIRNVVECETHREGLETLWRSKNIRF